MFSLRMRLALLTIACSLVLSTFLVRVAVKSIPQEANNGYAALIFDASYDDRRIGALLANSDIGSAYISESTQFVFLDAFGAFEQIPLDKYPERLERFDPRDDGYARKLTSFFVRDDKRLFFVPLPPEMNKQGSSRIDEAFTQALGSIPFTIEYLGYERPLSFSLVLFACAAFVSLLLSAIPPSSTLLTAALLPLSASLAFASAPGFALTSVLLALSGLIAEPLREVFTSFSCGISCRALVKERLHAPPLKREKRQGWLVKVLLCCLLIALYLFISITYTLPPLLTGAVAAAFLALLLFTRWIESMQGRGHRRFMPVPIIATPAKGGPLISRSVIPFSIASLLALLLPSMLGLDRYHDPGALGDPQYLISKADYENHLAFQRAFSVNPLKNAGADGLTEAAYMRYYVGDDGLISGMKEYDEKPLAFTAAVSGAQGGFPPFPLENLLDFLGKSGYAETNADYTGHELVTALLALILSLFTLFSTRRRSGGKKLFIYDEKRSLFRRRIAA